MKITARLKEKLELAKRLGYKRVYTVVGAYMSTTYCTYYSINSLLEDSVGSNYGGRPYHQKGMWTGHPNTRQVNPHEDIMYSELFHLEKESA
jgi:hypothetical protein